MKRKCNASANPIRTLPPRIVGDLEGVGGGGGGGLKFFKKKKSPGQFA